ncbi:hypothetical protein [Sorangium sp. So ce1099]|uniref:hypothetical protein n=1 Tax=Sorangium sp. So ce1099 TaxID=3133331 RepID=UPI003F60233E
MRRTPSADASAPACATRQKTLAALAAALSAPSASERGAKLVTLEGCAGLPAGFVRALRAELAPPACAEALVVPMLAAPPQGMSRAIYLTLYGHALASRVSRVAPHLPPLDLRASPTREDVVRLAQTLTPEWEAQKALLDELGAQVLSMPASYGRTIAASALAEVSLTTVDHLVTWVAGPSRKLGRAEMALFNAYSLGRYALYKPLVDQAVNAYLVSFRDFAALGVLDDYRANRGGILMREMQPYCLMSTFFETSSVLSMPYPPLRKAAPPSPPRRIAPDGTFPRRSAPAGAFSSPFGWMSDLALNTIPPELALKLPPPPPASPGSTNERLAGLLPTFYAGLLLEPSLARQPAFLRALMDKGLPAPHRAALEAADLPTDVVWLHAQARLLLGLQWMRASDIERAISLASSLPRSHKVDLFLATATALRHAPDYPRAWAPKAWVHDPRPLPAGFGDTRALAAIVEAVPKAPYAGEALYNLALVKEAVSSMDILESPAFKQEQSKRYRDAATLLPDPWRQKALLRAHNAERFVKPIARKEKGILF